MIFRFQLALYVSCFLALAVNSSISAAAPAQENNPCQQFGLNSPFHAPDIQGIPYSILARFRQKESKSPEDPLGDAVLFALAKDAPHRHLSKKDRAKKETPEEALQADQCAAWFFGSDSIENLTPPEQNGKFEPTAEDLLLVQSLNGDQENHEKISSELANGKLGVEGNHAPLNTAGMIEMFGRVIHQEFERSGTQPKIGSFHHWSHEFTETDKIATHGSRWILQMPKVLTALTIGVTGRFMVTGAEQELRFWILNQNDDSITLPEIFRQSYQLNRGDVYSSLMTIENVLAKDWQVANRENLPMTRKLTRITHEFGAAESRFGNWYHFFGIALYGFMNNRFDTSVVAETEVLGSVLLQKLTHRKADCYQKHSINRSGGMIGFRLRKLIQTGQWKDALSDQALLPSMYMNPAENFENKITQRSNQL